MIAVLASLWRRALPWLALAAAILLFILGARRTGEKVGRAAERLENIERTNDALRRMLEAGADRPRDRDDLVQRLREGGF
ncbi:MAG: hypothetical protein LBE86_01310 [Gemmobacter sp.]|nr:hypothetical protein [Gemmobacter sp.]